MGKPSVVTRTCYEAVTNSDLTEGRGHTVSLGIYTERVDAEAAAWCKGVQGYDADVYEVELKLAPYQGKLYVLREKLYPAGVLPTGLSTI